MILMLFLMLGSSHVDGEGSINGTYMGSIVNGVAGGTYYQVLISLFP